MPLFPIGLGGGSGFVFAFGTHRHKQRTGTKCVNGQQKRTITIFKLLVKIFSLATIIK